MDVMYFLGTSYLCLIWSRNFCSKFIALPFTISVIFHDQKFHFSITVNSVCFLFEKQFFPTSVFGRCYSYTAIWTCYCCVVMLYSVWFYQALQKAIKKLEEFTDWSFLLSRGTWVPFWLLSTCHSLLMLACGRGFQLPRRRSGRNNLCWWNQKSLVIFRILFLFPFCLYPRQWNFESYNLNCLIMIVPWQYSFSNHLS